MSALPRPATLRVLLADREGPGRRAVATTLRSVEGVALVGQFGDRADLAGALRRIRPDVLVIDDRLLRAGAHVLAGLGPHAEPPRVVVLGVDDSPAFAARARRLGAEAWILKDRADEQLTALLGTMTHLMIGYDYADEPSRQGSTVATRLLVGYDGSASARSAVEVAAKLFPGADTTVANVHAAPLSAHAMARARTALPSDIVSAGLEEMGRETLQLSRETAEEGAELARAAGLRASASTLIGDRPWRVLLDAAGDVDALVCGTRGEGPLERVALGSTASSLVHHTSLPLLIVPAGDGPLDGPLVAGWDGSDGARAALEFAGLRLRGRELIVAHGWRSPVRHSVRGQAFLHSHAALLRDYAESIDGIFRDVARERAEEGAGAARELGLSARPIEAEHPGGDWHALVRAAIESGAAAVLVGSRGRGVAAATVLGSVASGLVHAGALPVLVVPS